VGLAGSRTAQGGSNGESKGEAALAGAKSKVAGGSREQQGFERVLAKTIATRRARAVFFELILRIIISNGY
jgi:hypothetical protein